MHPFSVHIQAQLWVSFADLQGVAKAEQAITEAVRRYLAPDTGGDDNTGWRLGQPLRTADLYRLLETHPDIRILERINLVDQDYPLGVESIDFHEAVPNLQEVIFSPKTLPI